MPPPYVRRGSRTFIALLLLRLIPAVLFLIAVTVMAVLKNPITDALVKVAGPNGVSADTISKAYSIIIVVGFLVFIILTLLMTLAAWLDYISFRFLIDENAFKIKSGIFNITEMSILYRQIQNVDVDRPLLYRLIGMSRLVVLTAGHEDPDKANEHDESEGVIDLIDNTQAESLQQELLSRSNIQTVREVTTPDPTEQRTN